MCKHVCECLHKLALFLGDGNSSANKTLINNYNDYYFYICGLSDANNKLGNAG